MSMFQDARAAHRNLLATRLGRSDRSAIGRWFWDIVRVLLLLVLDLVSIALVVAAAASPAAGVRYSGVGVTFAPLHYFYRQLIWILIALPVMITVSMLPRKSVRRLCLGGTVLFIGLLILVPIIGQEVNGAKRWINLGF